MKAVQGQLMARTDWRGTQVEEGLNQHCRGRREECEGRGDSSSLCYHLPPPAYLAMRLIDLSSLYLLWYLNFIMGFEFQMPSWISGSRKIHSLPCYRSKQVSGYQGYIRVSRLLQLLGPWLCSINATQTPQTFNHSLSITPRFVLLFLGSSVVVAPNWDSCPVPQGVWLLNY